MYAASKGHRFTVETLLSKGANAKVKDRDGRTASMYAAQQGNLSALEERLGNRPTLRSRFAQFVYEKLQPSKRHDYKVIASLLKEAETKQ
jgi:ankyrin repeat protein